MIDKIDIICLIINIKNLNKRIIKLWKINLRIWCKYLEKIKDRIDWYKALKSDSNYFI